MPPSLDEVLLVLDSLDDARVKCEAWRRDYNEVRPHSSIGNQTPMEHAFASGQACLP